MNKNLVIIFAVIGLVLLGIALINLNKPSSVQNIEPLTTIVPTESKMEDINELKIEDIKEGVGQAVKDGDTVGVNYTGTLISGTKFDSSYDRGQVFKFTVGAGQVIQGWEKGLIGMKEGGLRKLTIPSSMAYGQQGIPGTIPSNTPLVFEIELISIE